MQSRDVSHRDYWERDHGFRRFDHPVVRLFAEQRLATLASWIDLRTIGRALDVGCGDGFSTYYTREHIAQVHATDRSQAMLSRHPLRQEGCVVSADAMALPYADASFDLVYGWEILHHVSDPSRVVGEMARVSRRFVLVIEPNRNHPAQFAFALVDREHRRVLRYSQRYLKDVCRRAGLRILRSATGGHIFPNRSPLWMARLASRWKYESALGISNWVLAERP